MRLNGLPSDSLSTSVSKTPRRRDAWHQTRYHSLALSPQRRFVLGFRREFARELVRPVVRWVDLACISHRFFHREAGVLKRSQHAG